ncbi:hypothetical protein K438DRAFT_1960352 [Mycena galopus ATCC 62051]|nr:hypothetical protein K438DRAFT_1960352 [Mycena galopus ATCC 62051]
MSRLALILLQLILTGQSFAALFPARNDTTHSAALEACNQLETSLGSPVVQSSGAEYQTAATNAWNLQNSEFQPTCIVFPRTSAHVQTAMKAIYAAGSHYAVQAGSHSAMKGWNSVQDGVLIIFTCMANASYDPAADSITLEPGIHWQDAVNVLAPFGVAPVGGRAGDVGTGLLLGGGLSYLSPSQGYAADNFKALDVVLVNGDMVTATATNEYSDLFRALKGGGNRFGIVTRYELIPVHIGTQDDTPFFGGIVTYNSSNEALVKATAKYVREVNDPNAVLLVILTNIIEGEELVPFYTASMFYHGSELPVDIFGDFLSIPAALSRGFVQKFGASALVGDDDLFLDAFKHWTNFSAAFTDVLNYTTIAFTPIPQSQVQAGISKGGNIISPPRGGFAAVYLGEQFNAGIEDVPPAANGFHQDLNECEEHQKVFETYGDYELLKQIYAKYDPTRFNVEHTQGPIGL